MLFLGGISLWKFSSSGEWGWLPSHLTCMTHLLAGGITKSWWQAVQSKQVHEVQIWGNPLQKEFFKGPKCVLGVCLDFVLKSHLICWLIHVEGFQVFGFCSIKVKVEGWEFCG